VLSRRQSWGEGNPDSEGTNGLPQGEREVRLNKGGKALNKDVKSLIVEREGGNEEERKKSNGSLKRPGSAKKIAQRWGKRGKGDRFHSRKRL